MQLFAYLCFIGKQGMLAGSTSGWAKPPFLSIVSSHDNIMDMAPNHFGVVALQFPNLYLYLFRMGHDNAEEEEGYFYLLER